MLALPCPILIKNYCITITSPDGYLLTIPGVILLPNLWTNCQLILFTFLVITSTLSIIITRSPFFMRINVVLFSLTWAISVYRQSSDWFIYTLVIIFLGGMMVMFTYASSLSSLFKLSMGKAPQSLAAVLFLNMLLILFNKESTSHLIRNTTPWIGYSWISFYFMVMMVFIIIAVLFIVVKLVQINEGPIKIN